MPNTLTTAQLQSAKAMITSGNLTGFYNYMAGQGYGYANLALGVVQCTLLSGGSTAQNYMYYKAAQMGITLTPDKATQIETNLANQYIDTLIQNAKLTGLISADWTFKESLTGHDNGLSEAGVPNDLWTLYAPSQVLTDAQLQTDWAKTIDPSQFNGLTPAFNFTTGFAADMSVAATKDLLSGDGSKAALVFNWSATVSIAQATSATMGAAAEVGVASSGCIINATTAVQQLQTTAATTLAQNPVLVPTSLGTPARNSASFVAIGTGNTATINSGGTLSDLWLLQKNNSNGFSNQNEFYAAVLANNPQISNVNSIPAGATLNVPLKLSDGSITYNYSGGTSINQNTVTGEYHMVVPNSDGSGDTTRYDRTVDANGGFTVSQVNTNSFGVITSGSSSHQMTADGDLLNTTSYILSANGKYSYTTATDGHLIEYSAVTSSTNGDVELNAITSIDGISISEETSAALAASGISLQNIQDGTIQLAASADGKTLSISNSSGQLQVKIVTNPVTNNTTQTNFSSPSDPNIQTITIYDASGNVTSTSTITQTIDTTTGSPTYGQPVADTYNIVNKDGTGAITATGQRVVDPIDGSYQDTLIGSATTANPQGTVTVTRTDSQGNTTPVVSQTGILTLNNQVSAFNDAYSLIQAIQKGQTLPAVGSGLRLANDLNGGSVPALSMAGNAIGVVTGIQALNNALKTGDTAAGVVAGTNTFVNGVNLYTTVAYDGDAINAAADGLGDLVGTSNAASQALPYLNVANDLAHGNYAGVINASDPVFAQLGVWIDAQGTGQRLAMR